MTRPVNFDEFCEQLKLPYSRANQYFKEAVLNMDLYNDSQYFYLWFSNLKSKDQDTVYNNLQRMYDANNELSKNKVTDIKKRYTHKMNPAQPPSEEQIDAFMSSMSDFMDEINKQQILSAKLSTLTHLLSAADNYKRLTGSVEKGYCKQQCNTYNGQRKELLNRDKSVLYVAVLWAVCISVITSCFVTYVSLIYGKEIFIKFFEDKANYIIGGIILTVVGWGFASYKKIIKTDN